MKVCILYLSYMKEVDLMKYMEESHYALLKQRYENVLKDLTRARDNGWSREVIEYMEGQRDAFELVIYELGMRTVSEYIAIELRAKQDTYGNPRTLYQVLDKRTNKIKDIIDVGYRGYSALQDVKLEDDERISALWSPCNIEVATYKKMKKDKDFTIG